RHCRFSADCGPRYLVDPDQSHIEEALLSHHAFDSLARPVVRDLGQHLIKHDRSQMSKAEPPQQSEISEAVKAETQQQPEDRGRIKSQMMHETNWKPRKQCFAHRIE